jgi:hypothetical protein
MLALETWSDGSWRELSPGRAAGPDGGFPGDARMVGPGPQMFGPAANHALPAGTIDDGVVWVRALSGGFGVIDPYTLATFTLVTLETRL